MSTRKIERNTSTNNAPPKVFLGLSGGVDSAVSAALLKQAGYDVTGVFIKVWSPDFLPCTWREERRDAMRVAAHLDIPFLFFDFEGEYKKGVADIMIEEYKQGRTPNPDVLCNREVKFGAFWKKAKSMGADYIATGHYAQILPRKVLGKLGHTKLSYPQSTKAMPWYLGEGKDTEKDQSYFLWMLDQEDLSHTLFPVGHLEKNEVRALAKRFKLPVSEKKDSQGICFLGDVDIEEFLSHFVDFKSGDVLDTTGGVIGSHRGALLYTLGERRGFELFKNSPDSKPFYVVDKDMENNTITVSNDSVEIESRSSTQIKIKNLNWVSTVHGSTFHNLTARIRYRQKKFAVKIEGDTVTFLEPQAAASGQSIVFYLPAEKEGGGDKCLGGGVIL